MATKSPHALPDMKKQQQLQPDTKKQQPDMKKQQAQPDMKKQQPDTKKQQKADMDISIAQPE